MYGRKMNVCLADGTAMRHTRTMAMQASTFASPRM